MASSDRGDAGDLQRQAAALAYRRRGRRLEVVLVTSSQGTHWVVPKGNLEPGETARGCAGREAEEEAGLLGHVERRPLGSYRYSKRGARLRVDVFGLRVTEQLSRWTEGRLRRRKWVELEAAIERVREPGLKHLLAQVGDRLHRSGRRRTA